ncbi:DUF6968 family protein [Corynebacterium sp. 335C]
MPEILAQRTCADDAGEFTVGLRQPYAEGDDWYCEVFSEDIDGGTLKVGGVDAMQALRLAISAADAIVESRPGAKSNGIAGVF